MTENYAQILPVLQARGVEFNGYDFYKYLFPDNELEGDQASDFSHPNAVYLYSLVGDLGDRRLRRRIMLRNTWFHDYTEFVEQNPMTLCSGLSYRGRANRIANAQRMHALIFDLDGVGYKEIQTLFLRFGRSPDIIRTLPHPTFIVASGNGVHIYYVFRDPIDLYPNIKVQLKALKYALTFRIWEYKATSQQIAIQYQSINQGFRMVGSVNDKYGTEMRAFQVGDRVTLEDLNKYVAPSERVDINRPFQPSKITRAEAAERYPDWYQRVVVEGYKRPKKWDIAGKVNGSDPYALYHWWIRQAGAVRGGHRYYFLMCLAIYASKCDVPKKKLLDDMNMVFEELRSIAHENEFTREDIESALEAFSKEYYNFTLDDIEKLTDIRIKRNKRNGRKRSDHVKLMNFVRDQLNNNTEWRNKDGRPIGSGTAESRVVEYRRAHPSASVTEVARTLGISRTTVYKWWNSLESE